MHIKIAFLLLPLQQNQCSELSCMKYPVYSSAHRMFPQMPYSLLNMKDSSDKLGRLCLITDPPLWFQFKA